MSIVVFAFYSVLAFVLAASADWLEAHYVRAVRAWEDGDDAASDRAANYSCAMLLVGAIGLYACVEISWWLLVPELVGLRVGSKLAMRRRR